MSCTHGFASYLCVLLDRRKDQIEALGKNSERERGVGRVKGLFTELRFFIEKEERFFMGIPQQNTGISTTRYARDLRYSESAFQYV